MARRREGTPGADCLRGADHRAVVHVDRLASGRDHPWISNVYSLQRLRPGSSGELRNRPRVLCPKCDSRKISFQAEEGFFGRVRGKALQCEDCGFVFFPEEAVIGVETVIP